MSRSAEPVGHTCPMIDKIVSAIQSSLKLTELTGREEEEDYKSILEDIRNELWGMDDVCEDVRSANAELRDWGSTNGTQADDLEYERDNLQSRVDELENERDDLDTEVDSLASEVSDLEDRIKELEDELSRLESDVPIL